MYKSNYKTKNIKWFFRYWKEISRCENVDILDYLSIRKMFIKIWITYVELKNVILIGTLQVERIIH